MQGKCDLIFTACINVRCVYSTSSKMLRKFEIIKFVSQFQTKCPEALADRNSEFVSRVQVASVGLPMFLDTPRSVSLILAKLYACVLVLFVAPFVGILLTPPQPWWHIRHVWHIVSSFSSTTRFLRPGFSRVAPYDWFCKSIHPSISPSQLYVENSYTDILLNCTAYTNIGNWWRWIQLS